MAPYQAQSFSLSSTVAGKWIPTQAKVKKASNGALRTFCWSHQELAALQIEMNKQKYPEI